MSVVKNYLGSYRLIRLIRGGQTCNVWEAIKDGETDRVALKVLLGEHKSKKYEIEQLKHEAMIGSQMDHECVIKIFEYVGRYELPFLVMQLFNSRNLKQELRDNPQYVAMNIPVILQKCTLGLHHMHEKGWVHCDVKPDNFLVNEQGDVKLIDFSIAQPLRKRGISNLIRRRLVQGTRSYMSPEQIRGKPLDITSDVYGFGCVMYEIMAGKPPFSGTNPDELLQKHLRAAPPSVQAANRSVTDDYAELVVRCLAKSPASRPQSMLDLYHELKNLQIFRAGQAP